MRSFFWVISVLSAFVAALLLFVTLKYSEGAPQEAAGAAVACGVAIIPYVLARGIEELSGGKNQKQD